MSRRDVYESLNANCICFRAFRVFRGQKSGEHLVTIDMILRRGLLDELVGSSAAKFVYYLTKNTDAFDHEIRKRHEKG